MLTWMNTKIRNYTKWDELLKTYLNFYDKQYETI
jgi:hypothetical protein